MADRRETPDVLGELLSGAVLLPESEPDATKGAERVPAVEPESALGDAPLEASASSPVPDGEPPPMPGAGPDPAAEPKPAPKRGPSTRRSSRQRRSTPARWEYVEIVFCDHGGFRPRYINGKQVRNWKRAPLIHDYLNHLGQQGWELAGLGGRHKNQTPAYLKRRCT
jgi:hypothetical protein